MGKSTDDDEIQHPVEGKVWLDFDKSQHQFAKEVRNIRLGLAVIGFNPFGNMNLS